MKKNVFKNKIKNNNKNNNNKRISLLITLGLLLLMPLSSCSIFNDDNGNNNDNPNIDIEIKEEPSLYNDIHILFTGDTHSNENMDDKFSEEDDNLKRVNHASLKEYKDDLINKNNKVITIDLGDAIQGNAYASLTNGSYMINNMNEVSYDISILGNHEFSYGIDRLEELVSSSNSIYLNGNVEYIGSNEESSGNFLNNLNPTYIVDYGYIKIGFFSLLTPETLYSGSINNFKEDERLVYSFYEKGVNGEKFYDRAQELVDSLRYDSNCDLVIGLTHLGDNKEASIFNSRDLIYKVEGIDVILDGHAHNVIEEEYIVNEGKDLESKKDDKSVLLSSPGAYFNYFGDLTIYYNINNDGKTYSYSLSSSLIDDYEEDKETLKSLYSYNSLLDASIKTKIGSSEVTISEYNTRNNKLYRDIRNRENALGNFVADSFKYTLDTDIAFINGGGVRNSINKGDISLYDLINIQPFNNKLSVCYSNGRDIMDALEFAYRNVSKDLDDPNSYIGGFLQVSGLKFEVDTSVKSNVVIDEKSGNFIKVDGPRRVKNISIYSKTQNKYLPLQINGRYKVGSISYLLSEDGSGFTMFKDNEFILKDGISDYEALRKYLLDDKELGGLGGIISKDKYFIPEGRITIL